MRQINQRLPHVSQTKGHEFSRATVDEHWAEGLEDVRDVLTHHDWMNPRLLAPGMRVHQVTD